MRGRLRRWTRRDERHLAGGGLCFGGALDYHCGAAGFIVGGEDNEDFAGCLRAGLVEAEGGQEFTRISRAVCGDDAGGGRSVVDFPPECHGVLERVGEAFLAIADAGGAGAGVVEAERVWREGFVSLPPVSAEISDGGGKTA